MDSFRTGIQVCSKCGIHFEWKTILLKSNTIVLYRETPYKNVSNSYKYNNNIWRVVTNCPNCNYKEIVEISLQGDDT